MGYDAGGEPVEGHTDLGPEAGSHAGKGVESREEKRALTGEWFGEVVARAPGDGAPGQGFDEAETAARRRREGRNGRGVLIIQGFY